MKQNKRGDTSGRHGIGCSDRSPSPKGLEYRYLCCWYFALQDGGGDSHTYMMTRSLSELRRSSWAEQTRQPRRSNLVGERPKFDPLFSLRDRSAADTRWPHRQRFLLPAPPRSGAPREGAGKKGGLLSSELHSVGFRSLERQEAVGCGGAQLDSAPGGFMCIVF